MDGSTHRRFNELLSARTVDATLSNLLALVSMRLEFGSRLGVCQFEAELEGQTECARLCAEMAVAEEEQLKQLLTALSRHLGALDEPSPGRAQRTPRGVPCDGSTRTETVPPLSREARLGGIHDG
jgi:hypothetical protein